jgi:hypothetical protein
MASNIGRKRVTVSRTQRLSWPWARGLCVLGVCVLALLSTSGCAWYSYTPKERVGPLPKTAPRALNTLVLGEPRDAVLDCSRQECNQWYRLDVPLDGVLRVVVETEPDESRAMMRLIVRQIGRDPVGQTMGGRTDPLSVESSVREALYMVLVQAGGGRVSYTVTAELAPDPR